MPGRIYNNPMMNPPLTAREERDLVSLRNKFTRLISNDGMVSGSEAQRLLNDVTRDRQVTPAEVNLLAQGFYDNASRFAPDAAMAMQSFIAQFSGGQPMAPAYVPPQPTGWSPYGGAADHPDITALRQNIGMLMDRNQPVSASEAQALIHRATRNTALQGQGVAVLAQAYQMNQFKFSPEAQVVIGQFLASAGAVTGGYMPGFGPSTTYNPALNAAASGYRGYGDAFVGTPMPMPMSRSDERDMRNLRDQFVRMIRNDGGVTAQEVHNLLSYATRDRRLTPGEAQVLAQGFRDNQALFAPDAANMMMQFLAQYGL